MSHTIKKPFHAVEAQRIVQPGEPFVPTDASRAGDLERAGLIVKASKVAPKPANKDAAPQRRAK